MLDIGWQELFIVAVLALLVVGPKDLPRALRAVTGVVRKARGLAREFQSGLDEMMREAELDEVKKEVEKASRVDLEGEVKKTVDPAGSLTAEFDPREFADDLKRTVEGGPPTGPMAASGTAADEPAADDGRAAAAESEPMRKAGG